jgi:hypothetical protein
MHAHVQNRLSCENDGKCAAQAFVRLWTSCEAQAISITLRKQQLPMVPEGIPRPPE